MGGNAWVYAKDIQQKVEREVEKDEKWKESQKEMYERVVYYYNKDSDLDQAVELVAKEFKFTVEQVEDSCLVMEAINDLKK